MRFKKGHRHSKEVIEKMRIARKNFYAGGGIHPMAGTKMSEKHKEILRASRKEKNSGKNNWMWKGNNVGYGALHCWIKRNLGSPQKCEHCNEDGLINTKDHIVIHWANKDHKYRRKIEDWMRLCVNCHREYDRKNFNIKF